MLNKGYIHIITSLESGGSQKCLYDYLLHQSEEHNANTVVYTLKGDGFYTARIVDLGVTVISCITIGGVVSFIRSMRTGPGFVKCWMYHSCLLSVLSLFSKKKVVWSIHHGQIDRSTDSMSTILACYICALLSYIIPFRVVFVSEDCERNHLECGFSKSKSIVIYNYIDLDCYFSVKERCFDILYVGRDHPNKNMDLFIRFSEALIALNPGITVAIVGVGTGTEKWYKRVDSSHLANYTFFGELENVHAIYRQSKVYVCTSKVESFGLTILEAMCNGCQVICPSGDVFFEITGGFANYFEKYTVDSLIKVYDNIEIFDHADIYNNILRFSKENTLDKLFGLLNEETF